MFYIRKATTADIPLINNLAKQVFPETYKNILSQEQIDFMMDWMYSPESLRKQMEEEGHTYYIAYEECEAAGYVSIQPLDKDLFELQKIYVLPYYQKYRLGRQLFEQAVKAIRELHPEPCRKGHPGTASGTLYDGTSGKPPQSGIGILRTHGNEEITGGRFPHRQRILHERLHHGTGHPINTNKNA